VPAEVRPIIDLLPYQRADVESDARFNWSCWSRQIGKSFTKSLRRILRGLARRRNQIFLSAGERQSRELMLKAQQHCRALAIGCQALSVPAGGGLELRHLEVRLPNGVRIIGLPANPQTVRGFTGDVFLDEFAMHRDDREIWAAVFPTILRGDGELDVASTPKGCSNIFARLRDNEQFRRTTVTLYDAIGQGLALDADEVRRSMNDEALFRQEFLCEFLDEVGAFLTYEQIAACEDGHLDAELRLDELCACREPAFVGADVARRRDLTVIWVLVERAAQTPSADDPEAGPAGHQTGDGGWTGPVLWTAGIREMRNAPFREQFEALCQIVQCACVRRCCIDATGVGMALAEAVQEVCGRSRVEPVTFTSSVKERAAGALKRRIEDRTVRIPVDEAIRNDLHSVRWDVTAGGAGRFVVGSGADSHADRFWALALAVRAAEGRRGGPVEAIRVAPARFARKGIW